MTELERRPRILALHGLLSGRGVWGALRREMHGSVRLITPDLPGHGPEPGVGGPYTLEPLLDRLEPLLEEHEPDYVVGHSMGAIIALGLARRHPGAFKRVGVIGMPVFASREEGDEMQFRRSRLYRVLLRDDRVSHFGCAVLRSTRPLWLPLAGQIAPSQPRAVVRCVFDHTFAGHSGGMTNLVCGGLVPELAAAVTTPVVAMHADRDGSAPFPPLQAIAHEHGWRLHVARNAKHQVIVERPALVARWVRHALLGWPAFPAVTAGGRTLGA